MPVLVIVLMLFSLSAYGEKLPIEAFGALPAASEVQLSPNGKKLPTKV